MKFIKKYSNITDADGMPIRSHDGYELRLSEKNLLSLLTKLYTPGSQCTIVDSTGQISVIAEKDNIHYNDPDREGVPAGTMHPTTEFVVNKIKDALAAVNAQSQSDDSNHDILGYELELIELEHWLTNAKAFDCSKIETYIKDTQAHIKKLND